MRPTFRTLLGTAVMMTALSCASVMTASAEPQTYELDGEHTHIIWQVDRFGFANTIGSFTDISGTLILDEATPENSKVEAIITLSGLRSDLLEREDIVRGKFWLDAENHPVITFKSTSVTLVDAPEGEQRATVAGDMILSGGSAPLVLDVVLNKIGTDPVTKKKAAGFTAKGAFMRSDFGVKTAVGPVGDEVSFQIEALAVLKE